ncbi:hypothetical protein B0P06_004215 [Clostridium saccharoperbutylacetonicum]|nr:hypothetical protein [Clostridium saccharoperbutylacetonicum]
MQKNRKAISAFKDLSVCDCCKEALWQEQRCMYRNVL